MKNNTPIPVAPKKKGFRPIYLACLFPLLSTALYLLVMGTSTTEEFLLQPFAIIAFLAATAGWGYLAYLFAKKQVLLFPATLVSHIIPILTTIAYTIVYVIAQIQDTEALENTGVETVSDILEGIAILIGGLGTGIFGVVGEVLWKIIPLSLFEVYINFGFMVIVFIVGYSIGGSGRSKKK